MAKKSNRCSFWWKNGKFSLCSPSRSAMNAAKLPRWKVLSEHLVKQQRFVNLARLFRLLLSVALSFTVGQFLCKGHWVSSSQRLARLVKITSSGIILFWLHLILPLSVFFGIMIKDSAYRKISEIFKSCHDWFKVVFAEVTSTSISESGIRFGDFLPDSENRYQIRFADI